MTQITAFPIETAVSTLTGAQMVATIEQAAKARPVYATMAITQRDANDGSPYTIAVVAHPSGNSTLNPLAAPVAVGVGPVGGYYKIEAFIAEGVAKELTVSASAEIVVPNNITSAVMIVPVGWAGFRHSANGATVSFVVGIERAGQMLFSQRPTSTRQPNGGDLANVSGGGQIQLLAGDKLSAWVASDTAGTITVSNSNFTIHMLEDLT